MKILFYSPSPIEPIGAVKELYRQVEVLNKLGLPAFILHRKKNYRPKWFSYTAPVIYAPYNDLNKEINEEDVVVTLEYGAQLLQNVRSRRIVIFNQAPYLTFRDWRANNREYNPYVDPRLCAVLVLSDDSQAYVKQFTNKTIFKIRPYIDIYDDKISPKNPVIAYYARRELDQIEQVIQILKLRRHQNKYSQFSWKPMKNVPHVKAINLMKSSAIYLSFVFQEGFSIPIAEAMKCKCLVVGYGGFGGDVLFNPSWAIRVPSGDVKQYIVSVEKAMEIFVNTPILYHEMTNLARKNVEQEFSYAKQVHDTSRAWKYILSKKDN